jgi:hypothetical protein
MTLRLWYVYIGPKSLTLNIIDRLAEVAGIGGRAPDCLRVSI